MFGGLFHEEFLIILHDSETASGQSECHQCIPCPMCFSFTHASRFLHCTFPPPWSKLGNACLQRVTLV